MGSARHCHPHFTDGCPGSPKYHNYQRGNFLDTVVRASVLPSFALGQPSPHVELVQRCPLSIYCILGWLRVGALISPIISPQWGAEGRREAGSQVLFSFSPNSRSLCPAWDDGEEENPDLTHFGPKESAGEFTGAEQCLGEGIPGRRHGLGKGLAILRTARE